MRSFAIARRLLGERQGGFGRFVAWVAMAGLAVGVAALITVLSVMNGFERQMQDRLLNFIPQVQLYAPSVIEDWQPVADELKGFDPNIIAIAPNLNTQAMLTSATPQKKPQSLVVFGVLPNKEAAVTFLSDSQGMSAGKFSSLNDDRPNLVIGEALADEYGLGVGDRVQLVIARPADTPTGISPSLHAFYVSGIFRLSKQTETHLAFAHLDSVAKVLDLPIGAASFKLKLKDVYAAHALAERLKQTYPDWVVQDWTQTHGSIYSTLKNERQMMGLLLLFVLMVAGFNLVSSLVMTVTDKQSDIAILKTMGATPSFVRAVFFWQGFLIVLVGTALGTVLGLALSLSVGSLSAWVDTTFNLNLFDRYFVTELPSEIHALDVAAVVVSAFVVGILATYYPSQKAARLPPAQALNSDN